MRIYGDLTTTVYINDHDHMTAVSFNNSPLTSTLWRIREQLGQEKTDKLVAQTILSLNTYLDKRSEFYQSSETPWKDKIGWYDVYYGLMQKDKELFEGKDIPIITKEFARTGYPIDIVKQI